MRQAEQYTSPPEPTSPHATRVRVLSETEYEALEERARLAESVSGGLRVELREKTIELSQRLGELKSVREDQQKTLKEKRRAQDLYVTQAEEITKLRYRGIVLEKQLSDERALHEALPSKLATVLTLWREHDQSCDHGCVAAIELTADQQRASLCRGIAGEPNAVSAYDLLIEAMHGGNEDLLRVVAASLARGVSDDVPMIWALCGHPTTECDPCSMHETCNSIGETCQQCLKEDEHSARADYEYDRLKGGDE